MTSKAKDGSRTGRTFVIAEAGVNHNGSMEFAARLVAAAAAAGADAVKFQAYRTDELATFDAPKADYQAAATGSGESQFAMLKRLELAESDFRTLADLCRDSDVEFMTSPFDPDSVRMLVGLGATRLKIASGEITNARLLLSSASTGLPVLLSTGMSDLGDITAALGVLAFGYLGSTTCPGAVAFRNAYESAAGQELLRERVTLLHCTTEYPAPLGEVNLRAMATLRSSFNLPVGYSDHTSGINIAPVAVACGATVIEKHLTLDRQLPGPDHKASLEPTEFAHLVARIRSVEAALGSEKKAVTPSEIGNRIIARRSLVAARDIEAGETFDEDNLAVRRPGTGISAIEYYDWLGRSADRNYRKDEVILP